MFAEKTIDDNKRDTFKWKTKTRNSLYYTGIVAYKSNGFTKIANIASY